MIRHTLILFALAAAPAAQTTPELIGITAATPLIATQDPGDCSVGTCTGVGLPATTLPFEGGTAYDATLGAVWVAAGGASIVAKSPDDCSLVCPGPAAPPWSHVTGMAADESSRSLYVSDDTSTIYTLDLGCPPKVGAGCAAPVPPDHLIGGLAVDDGRRLFYSTSDFRPAMPPTNMIHVAPVDSPCAVFCTFRVPPRCGMTALGPITGLAYDACSGHLWITDGTTTMGLSIGDDPCMSSLAVTHCCSLGLGADTFAGLCWVPSRADSYGASCTNDACPVCPGLVHSTVGDPILGNADFGLALDGAPGATPAWLLISFGACSPAGIDLTPITPFCGKLHTLFPAPISIGAIPTSGAPGTCTGSALFTLKIPLDPAFCGAPICSQWVGLCGGAAGTYMSNALGAVVSSS